MATVTSGPFPVHFAGNGSVLYIAVSSFDHADRDVLFSVEEVQTGSRVSLRRGRLSVPPYEAAIEAVEGVDGKVVEVILELPHPALKPTVSLVGTFRADAGQAILLWIPPDGFAPAPGYPLLTRVPRRRGKGTGSVRPERGR